MKRSQIGDMTDSNDIWILGCYTFENCFQYQMRYFSAKGLTSSNTGIFKFLTGLEKKVIKISAFLPSCVEIVSTSTSVIFSEDHVGLENKGLIVFQNFIIHNISRL